MSELNDFQNEVWGSLEKYSIKLGGGLAGIQGECWTLLDMAVNELVAKRDLLRWRDAETEPPEKSDWYTVLFHDSVLPATAYFLDCKQFLSPVAYWRPIGPLPGK